MTLHLSAGEYVQRLRRIGLRPGERLVNNILHCGDAAVEPLIELATRVLLLYEEPPVAYAPIHALRLLGELRPLRMVEPLLKSVDAEFKSRGSAREIWQYEVPQMIGRIGAAVVAPLWSYIEDPACTPVERDGALLALAYATVIDKDVREPVIAELYRRLMQSDDRTLNAGIVRAIAYLGLADMYGDIMARYRASAVNQERMPASAARQMLLSQKTSGLANDAKLSLWERYDRFGPFPEPEDMNFDDDEE
ncbi:hypothetical protein [Roseiflexus castenholzii]|jgi:hypothetical protein|uniref:PBS lyase HEAT domain protein repeat-containing protein n=1 Tax=Roseiflexus castenholzii (strain DSM 13941 / HLO8) TaxID=383372 RepID=A7NM87_ROSCS|nr:hypothetical protein [Roseiflexus castenholzii]ABU58642.1 conserved hypothetical protein [Roseiflexus castenholzii DSM 13941]